MLAIYIVHKATNDRMQLLQVFAGDNALKNIKMSLEITYSQHKGIINYGPVYVTAPNGDMFEIVPLEPLTEPCHL